MFQSALRTPVRSDFQLLVEVSISQKFQSALRTPVRSDCGHPNRNSHRGLLAHFRELGERLRLLKCFKMSKNKESCSECGLGSERETPASNSALQVRGGPYKMSGSDRSIGFDT